jgi:hypothetical protein
MCRVTGTVRYQGKAVPHITVRFVPADGPESIGDTDESGVYKLTHGKAKSEGAVRGKHKVFFVYRPRTPQEEMDIQSGKASPPPEIVAILAKYGSLDTTTLSFEVKDDGQVIDIPLD